MSKEKEKMKFNIFKWWEPLIKPLIYGIILIATAVLIIEYSYAKDDVETLSFSISILYALILFLVTIPISKFDGYTAEKLYERESFYLTLKKLREVTSSTIQKVDANDLEGLKNNIISFQIFTGREERMLEEKLQGKKIPVYVREKGFTYSSEMQELEMNFLKLYEKGNKEVLRKCANKLCKCYKKNCKRLENNYNRIARIYGGALFDLIERDSTISDTEYSLNYIGSKVDELLTEISSLKCDLDGLSSQLNNNQRELFGNHKLLAERLDDIENTLFDMKDSNVIIQTNNDREES